MMKRNISNVAIVSVIFAILVWFTFLQVKKIVITMKSINHIEAMGYNTYLVDYFVNEKGYTIIDFAGEPKIREEYNKWKGDMFKN